VRVLVLNPGSSSLKATVLEPPDRSRQVNETVGWGSDATAVTDRAAAVRQVIGRALADGPVHAVGYRVVHGGDRFVAPTRVDDEVVAAIRELADLAPLHNRVAAEVIEAGRAGLPAVPHVAAFDTAFHATLPPEAYRYPVPAVWLERWGIRRFGFHGISVQWSVRRAGELLGREPGELRLVVAHLGSGCSVTAVDRGRSVDTSMGMTPIEGLMMGTRSGSIDPGVILRLVSRHDMAADDVAEALDHRSGLAGVSGLGSDVRVLLRAESEGHEEAALGLALFVRRAAQAVAAAVTTLPAIDALVFSGGIGEHAGELRARIAARLGALGIQPLRRGDDDDGRLDGGAGVAVLRVEAREDVVIAEAAASVAAPPGVPTAAD
jgi:acetate kinase